MHLRLVLCLLLAFVQVIIFSFTVNAESKEASKQEPASAEGAAAVHPADIAGIPESEFAIESASQSERNTMIPEALVRLIEQEYIDFVRKADPKNIKTEEELRTHVPRSLLNITPYFIAATPGVLRANTKFFTPLGGGTVDMAEVVNPLKGRFFFRSKVSKQDHSPVSDAKVFFISNGRRKKMGDEQIGAGCGTYYDISKYFNKKMLEKGIEAFTANQRYVHLLAGSYLFYSVDTSGISVGSLTLTDTRFAKALCRVPEQW